jgi:biopolymer transport protein ExbD
MNIVREIGAVLLPFSKSADKRSPQRPVLKISVLSSGRVLLDGNKATVAKVRKALAKVSSERGTVWYYREKGEPPSQAIEIVKLVVENRLPISLSSRPDFSDYIDDEGQSRPRK